jgi:hypothetical protein
VKRGSARGRDFELRGWNLIPWLVVLLLAIAPRARADDATLEQRLGPELTRQVDDIVQTARAESLPTAPLVATALEGTSKHVAPARIVAALERYLNSLREARATLGAQVGDPVLVAAAAALRAGLAPDSLSRLHAARPDQSLLVPLVVLGDVIARRVPPDAGGGLIISLVRAGANDVELMRVRESIDADIRQGAMPLESAGVRVHALLHSLRGASPEPSRLPARPSMTLPGDRP